MAGEPGEGRTTRSGKAKGTTGVGNSAFTGIDASGHPTYGGQPVMTPAEYYAGLPVYGDPWPTTYPDGTPIPGAAAGNAARAAGGSAGAIGLPTVGSGAPGSAPGSGPGTAPGTSGTADQQDAMAIIQSMLDQYGLGSLSSWAWQMITSGATASQVDLQLRQQPAFQQRFPVIALREKAGLPPLSPGEYVSYENTIAQLEHEAGLPNGTLDTTAYLAGDVSAAEAAQRVQQGYEDALSAPPEVRAQLQTLYGVTDGELAHFFLDPTSALPQIMQRYHASQIAGEGQITGYGQLTQAQAEGLAAQGISEAQARSGFATLGREAELFGALPGSAESQIDQSAQLGAQFSGDIAAQRAIARRASQRIAAFAGGGQFATTAKGAEGVGSAQGA